MRSLKWLIPGMQVKRWLGLLLLGVTMLALGLAYLLIELYQTVAVPSSAQAAAELVTLQPIPQWLRGLLFGGIGIALGVAGFIGLNQSLLGAVRPNGTGRLVDLVDRRRRRKAGPKIVTIGGGTGLSTLLRGLKEHTDTITAIVTVADDGGSSGRLRRSLGVHPPGDFRQCISALADTEPLMESLFEYRFGDGDLGGHAFGNLFIVAMTGITGSFENALRASSRVLAVRGSIIPSTLSHVTLYAELQDARVMKGEHQVPQGNAPIRRVFIEPPDAPAYPDAVSAILDADLVVLGPGSLYTSVLPNLLVRDITAALTATRAKMVYVGNVATQPGETDGYSLQEHVDAIHQHVGHDFIRSVMANDNLSSEYPDAWNAKPVRPELASGGPELVTADLLDVARPTRHDPAKLAAAVVGMLRTRTRSDRSAA